jgi:DNA-binding PadR family transcriptional regulator
MSRWNISDRDLVDSSELRVPSGQRTESGGANPSVGRGGSRGSSGGASGRRERSTEPKVQAPRERRVQHQYRDRTYSLRSSEMQAMIDIGRFRTVDVRDLARFVYGGDESHTRRDLGNLRRQGLIEAKTLFRTHRSARKIVTLTERGHRIVRKASGLPEGQRLYHGFVKPKDLDHDADLYKVYQKAVMEIQEKGAKPLRVRLDFELLELINRVIKASERLSHEERAIRLRAIAEENGLTLKGATIHLPDIQVEYETRDGNVERENLELISKNYGVDGIRGKAGAGFKMYARSGETNRVRRALADTGLVQEVLSL